MTLQSLKPAISTALATSSSSPFVFLNITPSRSLSLSPSPSRNFAAIPNPTARLFHKLRSGFRSPEAVASSGPSSTAISQGPDDNLPAPGQQFAQFGAGCFWGVELAFQRVPGVTKTEVGYTQGLLHNPTYDDICSGVTGHSEVVRVQYDPKLCSFDDLLDVFWSRHDPTTLNRQGNDVGSQYRSGIYFYTPEQEKAGLESMEGHQKQLNRKVVTEILPARNFYRAEEYHQQYLAKGGRSGSRQSAEKGCNDPIRCYG